MHGQSTRPSRFTRHLAGGASWGAAAVGVLTIIHFVALHALPQLVLPEILLLKLVGWTPEYTFRPAFFLFAHRGYLYVLPVAFLFFWQRTRPLALTGLSVTTWLFAAWVAAMACATAYAMHHAAGLLPGLVALPVAGILSKWRRWRTGSTIVLAGGFALGTLLAQAFYAFPFQDEFPRLVSPLWGFIPPVAFALVAVLWLSFAHSPQSSADRRQSPAGLWGLIACSLACTIVVGAELRGVRVQQPEPAGSRILDDWAYDVHVTGDPPQLVWTDRKHIHVLTDPYGEQHERYTVDDDEAYYVERIWASPTGGFYVQGMTKLEWWKAPAAGEKVSYRPAMRYRLFTDLHDGRLSPPWVLDDNSTVWTIAEDPVTRRLFTVSEYFSHYAVIDRDSRALIAQGVISKAVWPFWSFTANPAQRVLYATSALDDGGLYEMNLDSLAMTQKASNLYLYETLVDTAQNLLWGVRPLTGEVVAVDTRTYAMRYRVPVQFGLRDLQRDPDSGDLYTCSEIFGDIFRIDGQTRTASRIGWCGRLCRDMFLDSQRHVLWVATRDGICRIAIPSRGAQVTSP